MERVTQAEKAYTASLPSEQEQDEAGERRYSLEQSPLYKALVDLITLAEETLAQGASGTVMTLSPEEIDLTFLANTICDQLGGSDAPYAIDAVLS